MRLRATIALIGMPPARTPRVAIRRGRASGFVCWWARSGARCWGWVIDRSRGRLCFWEAAGRDGLRNLDGFTDLGLM